MKKLLLLLVLLPFFGHAQSISVTGYSQQTVMGLQKGAELNFISANGFGLGTFYQSTETISFKESVVNYPFTGMNLLFPIAGNCEKIAVQGSIKTGLVNARFLAITPELITNIKFTDRLGMAIGAGYRSGEASVSAKISFHIVKFSKS